MQNCSVDFFLRSYFCSVIYIYTHLNHANNMTARCGKDLNNALLEKSKSIFFLLAEVVSRSQIGDEET